MSDEQWLRASEAQSYIGRTERQLRRYATAGRVRTRTSGGRVEYNRSDLDTIRSGLREDSRPQVPDQQIMPAGELFNHVRDLEAQLQQSAAREGYLRAQLEQRLALTDERALRDELAAERQQRIAIEAALKRARWQRWQGWVVVGILVILVLVWYFFIR